MDIELVLRALHSRAPWRTVVNPIVHLIGAHPHMGFEDTLTALTQPGALSPEQTKLLERYLVSHLISGEKGIRLYAVSDAARHKIAARAKTAQPKPHPLVDVFPLTVTKDDLRNIGRTPPRFARGFESGKASALIFTGAGSFKERVTLENADLRPGALLAGEYEKVIGIRTRYVQSYDAVLVHKELPVVVVACDVPRGAPGDFAEEAHIALAHRMAKITDEDFEPINLWPAVEGIYGAAEGTVVELGFITNDESVKHLKARRNATCLRVDAYHSAGADSVGDALQPFKLAVRWNIKHDAVVARPELLLPGTARLIYKGNAKLYDAVVRNGLTIRDLRVVVSKLAAYI